MPRRAQPVAKSGARSAAAAQKIRLKPADPFELIRWLARSQSDPRKAVAELVQNSLDAGAKRVELRRYRAKGRLCLSVRDDGEGVLPELDRREALEYLATHVGHSRKMGLDPATRTQQVIAGKYGVGLLGFWAIGKVLELRTRVGASPLLALRLQEDSARAEIVPLPLRIDEAPTFTEALVFDVHETAQKALGGRRIADYLAAELRGQLLRREVSVLVYDDVARGTAQKKFDVVPQRFSGERLDLPAEVEVSGHPAVRVELYLARGAERPAIQVACAGTLVADDVAQLEALGLAVAPWVGRDVVGLVDFGGFNVPPGTRRGVMPDAAALAFVSAMEALSPKVNAELARLDDERRAAADRDVVRDIKRALRGFTRRLPRYELPRVQAASGGEAMEAPTGERVPEDGGDGAAGSEPPTAAPPATELPLFPVGPLASVRIAPSHVKLVPGTERRVLAIARDADGRTVDGASFAWTAVDPTGIGLAVGAEGPRPAAVVAPNASVGATASLRVEASQGARRAIGEATVEVVERDDEASLGIPEPHMVSDADGAWRSRMRGTLWEVNDAHEDYRALRNDGRARLRYLVSLLAKEIVLRSSARPDVEDVLESLVEVLAHAERNLRGG
jgi:hypothetical protein